MTTELPMEIAVTITRAGAADNARYTARWEAARFLAAKTADEVFRCSAAGKELASCVAAARDRVRAFCEEFRIDTAAIVGLDDASALERRATGEPIRLIPVTYNDWLSEHR